MEEIHCHNKAYWICGAKPNQIKIKGFQESYTTRAIYIKHIGRTSTKDWQYECNNAQLHWLRNTKQKHVHITILNPHCQNDRKPINVPTTNFNTIVSSDRNKGTKGSKLAAFSIFQVNLTPNSPLNAVDEMAEAKFTCTFLRREVGQNSQGKISIHFHQQL